MQDRYFNLEINNAPEVSRGSIILNTDLSCPREQRVTTINGEYEVKFIYTSRYGPVYGIHKRIDDSLPEKSNLAKNLSPNSSIARVILNSGCPLRLLDSPKNMTLKEISIKDILLHKKSARFLEALKNLPPSPRYGPLPKRK